MITADRFTAPLLPEARRVELARLLPDGYRLTVTHGGREFRANLYAADGELLDHETAHSPGRACEVLLSRMPVSVTLDAAGWVGVIEG